MSKKVNWEKGEVFALIEIWAEREKDLNSGTAKKPIFEAISSKLLNLGIERNALQVQRKISCLRSEYSKKKPGVTGSSPSEWQFYESVHQILHGSHYFNPENITTIEAGVDDYHPESPVVLDSMEESVTPNDMQLLSQDQLNCNQNAVPISQSSRAANDRKKRRLTSVGIQEDVLAFLKNTEEEDSVLMERMAKSQEDTVY
ncbi:unnamed protein product [Allacma fusca]|uniref:Myb/SANT-like DNA-binding domain-containing protein n=1 Tax=Allacma fusca TaxID=39272 RepID=A0A8J2KM36_9HEXA|nr:unnamed protein product [Allacma fusca]